MLPVVSVPAPIRVRISSDRRHGDLSLGDRSGESYIYVIIFGSVAGFVLWAAKISLVRRLTSYTKCQSMR
jgi:hypothetical protein